MRRDILTNGVPSRPLGSERTESDVESKRNASQPGQHSEVEGFAKFDAKQRFFASAARSPGGDCCGDRRQLSTRWTAELNNGARSWGRWPGPLRARHRKADGFVILPAAFLDGRMSREAWREVKSCLSTVRTSSHPSGFTVRAVRSSSSAWEDVPYATRVPIHATRVQIWQAIHRVRYLGARTTSSANIEEVGVAVEVNLPGKARN